MLGVYIRVSTVQQKDNYFVETQRERGVAFTKSIKEEYRLYDEALSGKDLKRPEFVRLLDDIEKGEIQKVWVVEFSRLTRDMTDALAIREIFVSNYTDVYVNGALMDLSTPEAVLMYNMKSSISEYERTNTISRIKRSCSGCNPGRAAVR
jgi:site-specific DNA recombinase